MNRKASKFVQREARDEFNIGVRVMWLRCEIKNKRINFFANGCYLTSLNRQWNYIDQNQLECVQLLSEYEKLESSLCRRIPSLKVFNCNKISVITLIFQISHCKWKILGSEFYDKPTIAIFHIVFLVFIVSVASNLSKLFVERHVQSELEI